MTERGLPIVDGAAACPFVAFDDARDDRADHPDPRHRCYAESPPTPRARAHQEAYCLSASFPICPTFQDWARREAARVLPTAGGAGSPAERLRDVPAQREAGQRPAAFGPMAATGDAAAAIPGAGAMAAAAGGDPAAGKATAGAQATAGPSGAAVDADDDQPLNPWELPARRNAHPEWSAPPPWAPPRPGAPGGPPDVDVDAPGFLRGPAPGSAPHEDVSPAWALEAPDDDAAAAGDGAPGGPGGPSRRQATIARLRALGIGDPTEAGDPSSEPPGGPRPVPGITRSVDPTTGRAVGAGRPSGAPGLAGAGAAGAGAAFGAGAAGGAPDAPDRSSSGLSKLLGWDRRPRVGSSRTARKPEKDPAWERPRKFEAYPTLKTRVGLPMPSRLILALGALLVAAAILFFVPPLLLKQSGGTTNPGATRTPGPSTAGSGVAAGSASASTGPTTKPSPSQQTYKVKQGDTLSTIAKHFGVTVDQILAANKNIKNPNRIAVGDTIIIPTPLPSVVIDGGTSPSP